MATITANQLAVGFFNMAAGGYAPSATLDLAANEAAAANAYIALPQSGLSSFAGAGTASNTLFAKALVARLMSGADAALSADLVTLVKDYMSFNPTMGKGQVAAEMIKAVIGISPADTLLYPAAKPFLNKVALADASTSTSLDMSVLGVVVNGTAPAPVTTFYFTAVAGETLNGTSGNDVFHATILDNSNTAQSGDKIFGGAGNDRMNLDIGNSQKFAITLESSSVEQVAVRAQATAVDSNNNNMGADRVQIDAQRMDGVTQWESNNSRADVIIEDVRIANGAATKSVTIAMVETDPGNVDFGVYFNQLSLRNTSSGTASINILLMDTAAAALTPATPLLNQNFNAYTFYANNVKVVLGGAGTPAGQAIDDATTYAQLQAAFQLALKTANVGGVVTDLSSSVTATLSGPVNMSTAAASSPTSASVAANFLNLTGEVLSLTTNNSTSISATSPGKPDGGWTAAGPAPITGAIVQTFNAGATSSAELVTSQIILDDVGMGSTGGDLVVGGMSVGETSMSRGVERFEIEVRDNSKLQTINGTNNALREVTFKNGETSSAPSGSADTAYVPTVKNSGNLTVNGNVNISSVTSHGSTGTPAGTLSDTILKGVNNSNNINGYAADHHGAFGFTDVRLLDATEMTGKLEFTAQITEDSIAKYITRVDTAANPAADIAGTGNTNFNVAGANFIYNGGHNNDTMVVTIDGLAAGSRSTVVSGQSDFTFNVNGGEGNDTITVNVTNDATRTGGLDNWASNQDLNNNITINGGDGNDTIKTPGAGDTIIDAGAGNDVVYTDNTGMQTVAIAAGAVGLPAGVVTNTSMARWVFNTYDQVNAVANGSARNLSNLRSDTNDSYNFYKGTVTVTFKGIPQAATITLANAATYKTTDLEINQAIKQAINSDATLSKLLVAQDGPGNTLVVTSLIDGAMTTADLGVTFAAAPATTVFSAAEIAGMAIAYGNVGITTNALALAAQALPNAIRTDYTTAMAQNTGGTNIVGAASNSTSDNFITPGSGNDVIVLGTTVGVDTARSSNEVVVLTPGFGDDVIVNFNVGGFGADHLNIKAFLTPGIAQTATTAAIPAAAISVGALSNTDNLVTIVPEAATVNDTTALVTAIIKAAIDGGVQATATKQVYVVVNATNVGTVYSVVNGTAVGDVVVTREGSIDLADTPWISMTPAALTAVGAQTEGASSAPIAAALTAVINNQVLVGTAGIDTLSTGGFTNVTMTGLAGADMFNINANGAVITDLTTGDAFSVTAGALTATVSTAGFVATAATTHTGGAVTLTAAAGGAVINMALAGGAVGYTLAGAAGNDTLTGSAFADTITTGLTGTDVVNGGAGDDNITAGGGTTTIDGGLGNDNIAGGAGIDTINVTSGVDAITAFGTAADVIVVSAGAAANVTTNAAWTATAASSNAGVLNITAGVAGVLNLAAMTGSVGATIIGAPGGNTITGTALADTITAGAAASVITGGAGADTITLGAAANADTVNITSGATADTITNFSVADLDVLALSVAGLNATIPTGALVAGTGGAPVALAAGAVSLQGVAGAVGVANGTNVFELTGITFATSALMEAAIETAGARALTFGAATTAGQDIIVAWYDAVGAAHVGTYNIGTAATTLDASGTYTELATLVGVAPDALAAGNFTIVA